MNNKTFEDEIEGTPAYKRSDFFRKNNEGETYTIDFDKVTTCPICGNLTKNVMIKYDYNNNRPRTNIIFCSNCLETIADIKRRI